MKKSILFLVAAALIPVAEAADLKLHINADSMKPAAGVKSVSGSIRLVPGKFGKAMLVERRTVNSFKPSDVILGDGVKLSGKNNTLVMPADSMVALPLTAVRPKSPCTLSFRYKGEGKITVTFNGESAGTFEAGKEYKDAAVVIVPAEDSGSLKIRTDKPVELTNVMFDKGIGFANTYHAPGPMRNVDSISLDPALYTPKSGAISCWLKTPWLKKDAKYASANVLLRARDKNGNDAQGIYVSNWSNELYWIYYGPNRQSVSTGLKMHELPESKDGWYHLVFNWKEEKGHIVLSTIVNGEKVFTARKLCKVSANAKEFTLGYVNGGYINGVMDDFALFSAPLSKEAAKKIFDSKEPVNKLYGK